ncbi:hypothetical protein [Bernardetia sp.]|uniref:hypothetical protein n=1 Tax=Bernardetia sp. TaxID=1937974 RepID=UPI0025BC24C7|nr:hypothetical protein [Bernardetia sp.]
MINWLRKLVGLGGTAKNLTSLSKEECREEIKAFEKKTNLGLFKGHVQNLYSTQRIKATSHCPRCESETEKKTAAFVCATNSIPQIIISTENYFCTNCSSALVDDKLLQKSCEKGKTYRGIVGFYIRENIQTYQSINEHIIRYYYDQNNKPSGIKITNEKIVDYDPKIHGSKGTKSQHKVPSSPVTLMDRVARRDKKESLTNTSKFKKKERSKTEDDNSTKDSNSKAARSERARLAMERARNKKSNNTKPKAKEEFAESVNDKKQDFKEKVERKSNFKPKQRQKPVVENPNERQNHQNKRLEENKEGLVQEKQQENQKETSPVRASQRKKVTSNTEKKVEEANPSANAEEKDTPKKNRRSKYSRSNRKTRSNRRPTRQNVKDEKEDVQNDKKNDKAKNENSQKQITEAQKTTESKSDNKKDSVIEKLHQNLQESSKASVKEDKQKEQQKESSRLARLKDGNKEERVSRRRPRSNVRPPIDLDLKTPNPRRRYNNTKNK